MGRLEVLKASLLKKKEALNQRINNHFATVKQANGQPLNDKRNGASTLARWEKQRDAIRTAEKEVEKTQLAIENEEGKIRACGNAVLPLQIISLVEKGELLQWRKHPSTFFVAGVDKGRICWDEKKKQVSHKYYSDIPDKESRAKFAGIYNELNKSLNK